jgi:hypothetical protein
MPNKHIANPTYCTPVKYSPNKYMPISETIMSLVTSQSILRTVIDDVLSPYKKKEGCKLYSNVVKGIIQRPDIIPRLFAFIRVITTPSMDAKYNANKYLITI